MPDISIMLRTSAYRGDHSANVCRAIEPTPEEAAVLRSLLLRTIKRSREPYSDWIEVRFAVSVEETVDA